MKNKWLVGGTALVLLAGAGVALWTGVLQGPDGKAAARSEATAPKGGKNDKKPDVPLEFLAREVVQPVLARMPQAVEFSGPLVAPQTSVLRAKAGGTLVALHVAEGSRVQAGQALGHIDMAETSSRVAERSAALSSSSPMLRAARASGCTRTRTA